MNYSIILGNLGNTCDRFLSSGYKEELDKDTMLKQASRINRVKGIELVGTWDIDESNVREMKQKSATTSGAGGMNGPWKGPGPPLLVVADF
jgi:xylose isomerase